MVELDVTHNDAISNIFLETGRYKRVLTRFNELIDNGFEAQNCKTMLIRGPSRVGKTQIVHACISQRLGPGWKLQHIPSIVVVEAPANCSTRNFGANILSGLRAPDPDYGTEVEITRRIAATLKRHEVKLLVIDEVHRLIDSDTQRIKRKVSLWLTGLLNQRVCPILLVGELAAQLLFDSNMYLAGRSDGEVLLEPYDWAVEAERSEFTAVMHVIGKNLGMAENSDFGDFATAHLIWEFSGGLLGEAANLISKSRIIARRLNRPKIMLDILETAADELRIGKASRQKNPFRLVRASSRG